MFLRKQIGWLIGAGLLLSAYSPAMQDKTTDGAAMEAKPTTGVLSNTHAMTDTMESSHEMSGTMESTPAMSHTDAMTASTSSQAGEMMQTDAAMIGGATLSLNISRLTNLGAAFAYEGWLIINGQPVSTGIFTVSDDGMASATEFVLAVDPTTASAFVLTIEPSPDPDPAPSAVHLLAGDLADGSAQLSVAHAAALGNDFTSASGAYILGIGYPAGLQAGNSYRNGIWMPSLNLPQLPSGWTYEGWVIGADGPITTGRFTAPGMQDSDGSGPAAGGSGTGPDFPGQDFLSQPIDLTSGYAAAITVEPEPDNSPAPFSALKPLADAMIEDVGDHGAQDFVNEAANFPGGVAIITK